MVSSNQASLVLFLLVFESCKRLFLFEMVVIGIQAEIRDLCIFNVIICAYLADITKQNDRQKNQTVFC